MKILWRQPTKSEVNIVAEDKRAHHWELIGIISFIAFLVALFPLIEISDLSQKSEGAEGSASFIFLFAFVVVVYIFVVGCVVNIQKKYLSGEFVVSKGVCVDKYLKTGLMGRDRSWSSYHYLNVSVDQNAEPLVVKIPREKLNDIACGDEILVSCMNVKSDYPIYWGHKLDCKNAEDVEVTDTEYNMDNENNNENDYIGTTDLHIRKAEASDISGIIKLLFQVNQVHADGRPDLFKSGGIKYTEADLLEKIYRTDEIIFVAVDSENVVQGYLFGQVEITEETTSLRPNKTFYIDDLCVDEAVRGNGIGVELYKFCQSYARDNSFDRITLHVWECNPGAMKFYEAIGFEPLYTSMEVKL